MKTVLILLKLVNKITLPLKWAPKIQKLINWFDSFSCNPNPRVECQRLSLSSGPVEVFSPKEITSELRILMLHGGGLLLGINNAYRTLAAKLSLEHKAEVWLVDYPLLPDAPYPLALNACFEIYKTLLRHHPTMPLVVMGDSVGGNLAVACLYLAEEAALPLPQATILFSPWLDLTLSGGSLKTNAPFDAVINPKRMPELIALYLKSNYSTKDYQISPLWGDPQQFPPLFIALSETEVLRDDALRFAEKAQGVGVDVTLEIAQEMPHDYPILFPNHPKSILCYQRLNLFIKRIIKNNL